MFRLSGEKASALRRKLRLPRVEKLEANQKTHDSVLNILADEIELLKKSPERAKAPDRL